MQTRITWYGHAAIGIETGGKRLLFDPFLTGNPVAAAQPDTLNPDYILISHGHGDHVGDAVSIAKRSGAMIISTRRKTIAEKMTQPAAPRSTRPGR